MTKQPLEPTFVMFKPDAVERGLVGKILSRFEDAGMVIANLSIDVDLGRSFLEEHYAEHKDKPFFDNLVRSMMNRKVILMEMWGLDIVRRVRVMVGATNALEAVPGTIRGDWGESLGAENLIHASDSPEAAERELNLWFPTNY